MKEYIKTVLCGVITGVCLMQMVNMAAQSWFDHPMEIGGEIILPVLLWLVGYIGWQLAMHYFNHTKRSEIYQEGYAEGAKLHNYRIIIPDSGDIAYERTES